LLLKYYFNLSINKIYFDKKYKYNIKLFSLCICIYNALRVFNNKFESLNSVHNQVFNDANGVRHYFGL